MPIGRRPRKDPSLQELFAREAEHEYLALTAKRKAYQLMERDTRAIEQELSKRIHGMHRLFQWVRAWKNRKERSHARFMRETRFL